MIDKNGIKAIAFDFGGTLDAPFLHWSDIYLKLYTHELGLPLTKETFWDSYVYAERQMESVRPVSADSTLYDTQCFKICYQFENLSERSLLAVEHLESFSMNAARVVVQYVENNISLARPVLAALSARYSLLLVSNYYGNLRRIVTDLGIADYFCSVTDSTIEGIRKPDSALWRLPMERAGLSPHEVVVVGDSLKNDILPARELGCQAVMGCPTQQAFVECVPCITSLGELLAWL